jgi:hypothetical protein
LRLGLIAVETADSVPLAEPEEVGAKVTLKVTLCPAESVVGKLRPVIEKPAPLMAASEMVIVDPPVLVNVSESSAFLPLCTLPNEIADGDAVRVEPASDPLGVSPPQPVSSEIPVEIRRELINRQCDRKNCNGQFLKN